VQLARVAGVASGTLTVGHWVCRRFVPDGSYCMRVTVVSLIVRQRAIERLDHRNGFFYCRRTRDWRRAGGRPLTLASRLLRYCTVSPHSCVSCCPPPSPLRHGLISVDLSRSATRLGPAVKVTDRAFVGRHRRNHWPVCYYGLVLHSFSLWQYSLKYSRHDITFCAVSR